jgi:hypothetical protein
MVGSFSKKKLERIGYNIISYPFFAVIGDRILITFLAVIGDRIYVRGLHTPHDLATKTKQIFVTIHYFLSGATNARRKKGLQTAFKPAEL